MAILLIGPLVGLGCGDSTVAGVDAGEGTDAVAAAPDAALVLEDAGRDASLASDTGPRPGDPATGDPELTIRAALDPTELMAVAEVRHGDRLYWECGRGPNGPGQGHIWASARLESDDLPEFDEAFEAAMEEAARLVLVEDDTVVLARNEALRFAFDLSVPGVIDFNLPVRMELNRAIVGETTRPSQIDGAPAVYRVVLPIPGGRTFIREAQVDTLVPDTELPRGC